MCFQEIIFTCLLTKMISALNFMLLNRGRSGWLEQFSLELCHFQILWLLYMELQQHVHQYFAAAGGHRAALAAGPDLG